MSAGELACTYATLILHDDGIPVTAGDSATKELANAIQVQGTYMSIVRENTTDEFVKVTDEMKSFKAYDKLRLERTNKRHLGARLKRAVEDEKEDK